MGTTILGVILGATIAIFLTIWIEYLRKPKLILEMVSPVDGEYPNGPAKKMRVLHLRLRNKALRRPARWMMRNPALQCHGTITFYHLDGQNVFGRSMPIRWVSSPEPVPMAIKMDSGEKGYLFDPMRMLPIQRVDIYAGESELMDVAARFDDDKECYGWNNLSYFSDPPWRNPDWKISEDRYLIKVKITSAGENCTGVFRLINDVPMRDFRLENPLPKDVVPE